MISMPLHADMRTLVRHRQQHNIDYANSLHVAISEYFHRIETQYSLPQNIEYGSFELRNFSKYLPV